MKKVIFSIQILAVLLFATSFYYAATAGVSNAKVYKIQAYGTGGQTTFFFDKAHNLTGCNGTTDGVAITVNSSATETQAAMLITAYSTGKKVSFVATDGTCSGDRPTFTNFSVHD